jgi:hypothetical protein
MQIPIDSRPKLPGPLFRWFRGLFVALLVLAGLGALGIGLFAISFEQGLETRTKTVAPAEVASHLATILMHWQAFGAASPERTDYSKTLKSVERQMKGLRGFSASGGFHGDGTDWYEVELAPDLAAELRAGLPRSTTVKPASTLPRREKLAPPWWPVEWPADAVWYTHAEDISYLILPRSGTRAWFLNDRW